MKLKEVILREATLRRGSRGENVRILQQQLLDLGFDPNGVDGVFGPGTERALRAFQERAGIQVDGIAGGQTQAALAADGAPRNAGAARRARDWEGAEGTPENPKEVTRLIVGQLNDYIFRYTPANWRRLRRTHEVVTVSDFGSRRNPRILMPRMPIQGQPPMNPDGPIYDGSGFPIQTPDDELIGMAQRAIDNARYRIAPMTLGGRQYFMIVDNETGLRATLPNGRRTQMSSSREEAERRLASLQDSQNESTVTFEEITLEDTDDFHEHFGYLGYVEEDGVFEAEYRGRKVKLNKPMAGDVKKFKVYVKNAKGNVVKVNFGQKGVKIKKSNPKRRKSFRARHNCDNPGPKWKARYWSCRKW